MDRIAAQMEYAKGTIYNHFPNKEEIVMALALESLELRRRMFEQASLVSPRSRYRMIAIGCACDTYALECQQHFAIEQMLRNSIVWDKASHERQELIKKYEFRCMAIVAGVVRDAVASQDLILPTGMSSEEFVFGFSALTYGTHALVQSSPSLLDIGVADPFLSIRYHAYTLMNGYQWQPLIGFDESESSVNPFSIPSAAAAPHNSPERSAATTGSVSFFCAPSALRQHLTARQFTAAVAALLGRRSARRVEDRLTGPAISKAAGHRQRHRARRNQPAAGDRACRPGATLQCRRARSVDAARYTGLVSAPRATALATKTLGRVEQIRVDLGDPVVQGQVLISLDARELAAQQQVLTSDLHAAEAKLRELQAGPRAREIEVAAACG